MVFAAMSVFLSFIAALATSDSRSALMCVTVPYIHTEQNTLIKATWGKRSGNKIHMSTRKQTWPSKT